jgi:hypothetical protein
MTRLRLLGTIWATGSLLVAVTGTPVAVAHIPNGSAPTGGYAPPQSDLTPMPAFDFAATPVPTATVQLNHEPPLEPSPRARCGRGSHPLRGMQGRVPPAAINSAQGTRGWTCNLAIVGHNPSPGGWRTWRYVDRLGHTCAFYDSSLAYPLTSLRLGLGPSQGVVVLEMSHPAHPVQTATLTSPPMLSPHESLNLNRRRGLLAANMGNGLTLAGLMSIYDVGRDCRHPVHLSTFPATRFGHESGFSRDGKTYWIAGGAGIAAVDVTDPRNPRTLWSGNLYAHGLSLNPRGTRLYDAEPINGNLVILDVSQIQARKRAPVVREISRLSWGSVTVPQNSAWMRIDGRPYLLEFDEFGFRFSTLAPVNWIGGARIISLADERHPQVISNLRLRVNQPAAHASANNDPTPLPAPFFNYSPHYCAIPRAVNPEIVACSFINSGLRVFNIENPRRPREVAYFIAPTTTSSNPGQRLPNAAFSQPAFDPERRQVWYTDATGGFFVLRLSRAAWRHPTGPPGN